MSVVQALPPYQLVNTRHGPMLANPNDIYIGQALLRYGEYAEIEAQLLLQLVSGAGAVVEVGANIGSHTVALATQAAAVGAEVIAFEPQPVVFQNLYGNLASFNMLALPSESTLVVEGLAQITDAGLPPLRQSIQDEMEQLKKP